MNFQPNFEQYKADQNSLERVPVIKKEFHFNINDMAQKVLQNQELDQKEIDDLEMVYDSSQDTEKELLIYIDEYRSKGIITKFEFLITTTYFLVANNCGPDSENLKKEFIVTGIPTESFKKIADDISIPKFTRDVLIEVYTKIAAHKE